MSDKKEADLTAILPEFQKFAPHRTEAEIQTILTKAIDYLHASKTLESAAPSAQKQAEKDTQNHLTSSALSKDKNMENNENTNQEEKDAIPAISSLPAELLPLVTKHLKAAGLPDHVIDCLHENAFDKKIVTSVAKKAPKNPGQPQSDTEKDPKNASEGKPMASDHQTEAAYNPEEILSAYVHQIKS